MRNLPIFSGFLASHTQAETEDRQCGWRREGSRSSRRRKWRRRRRRFSSGCVLYNARSWERKGGGAETQLLEKSTVCMICGLCVYGVLCGVWCARCACGVWRSHLQPRRSGGRSLAASHFEKMGKTRCKNTMFAIYSALTVCNHKNWCSRFLEDCAQSSRWSSFACLGSPPWLFLCPHSSDFVHRVSLQYLSCSYRHHLRLGAHARRLGVLFIIFQILSRVVTLLDRNVECTTDCVRLHASSFVSVHDFNCFTRHGARVRRAVLLSVRDLIHRFLSQHSELVRAETNQGESSEVPSIPIPARCHDSISFIWVLKHVLRLRCSCPRVAHVLAPPLVVIAVLVVVAAFVSMFALGVFAFAFLFTFAFPFALFTGAVPVSVPMLRRTFLSLSTFLWSATPPSESFRMKHVGPPSSSWWQCCSLQ